MRDISWPVIAAFATLAVVWGATFPFTMLVNDYLSPMQIVLARVVSGFVPLLVFSIATGAIRRAHLAHWKHFVVMSFLATSLYYWAYAWAAEFLLSGVASVLSGITPLFVFLLALVFLPTERPMLRQGAGVALGFLGVALIANPSAADFQGALGMGVLLLIAGSLSLSLSFIYARRFLAQHAIAPAALVTYQLGLASIFLLVFTPKAGMSNVLADPSATAGLVIGLGVFGTGLAYLLYYFIVQRVGAVAASSATYLPPVVGLAISVIIMREPTSWTAYAAMGLIFAGVWLLRDNPNKGAD